MIVKNKQTDRMEQHAPVWESLLEAPMIGGFYHRWERENEVRKQVMNCAKCWQEFQSKQNWNIIWRIPLEWLYGYARRAFVEKWHLSKGQSSEGFNCEYIHKKWWNRLGSVTRHNLLWGVAGKNVLSLRTWTLMCI